MIDIETITINECLNDGLDVNLFFDHVNGGWQAYGVSAYGLWNIRMENFLDVSCGYSYDLQMPCVTVDECSLEKLYSRVVKGRGGRMSHLRFRLSEEVDMQDYIEWANNLRRKFL